jgi:hypothetical protein
VVSAGVGLRGAGTGTIDLTGIPSGATIQRAFLYWATLGTSGALTAPTLNGMTVSGTHIGRSDDPFWGSFQSYAYRADVTSLVPGNGSYTIAGLPHAGPAVNDSQGANLVVIYSLPGAPARTIVINDGAVTLSSATPYYATQLSGFTALDPPGGARLTFLVGDGQAFIPEYAGLNTTLLAINEFSGSNRNYWETRTYDVSTVLAPGTTSAEAIVSTGNDSLVWVAAILSVPQAPPLTLTNLAADIASPAPVGTLIFTGPLQIINQTAGSFVGRMSLTSCQGLDCDTVSHTLTGTVIPTGQVSGTFSNAEGSYTFSGSVGGNTLSVTFAGAWQDDIGRCNLAGSLTATRQ